MAEFDPNVLLSHRAPQERLRSLAANGRWFDLVPKIPEAQHELSLTKAREDFRRAAEEIAWLRAVVLAAIDKAEQEGESRIAEELRKNIAGIESDMASLFAWKDYSGREFSIPTDADEVRAWSDKIVPEALVARK